MRKNNRNPIKKCRRKLPQFTTMNVIDGQAGLVIYSSLIFYSLTIYNILNIIVLLILAGVSIATLIGDNGILTRANDAKTSTDIAEEKEKIDLAIQASKINENLEIDFSTLQKEIQDAFGDEAKVTVQDVAENGTSEYVITLPNGNIYKEILENATDILVLETDTDTDYDAFVYGYKIALDGKIGLRFYFEMPATWLEDGDKYAVLTRNGKEEKIQLKQENLYTEKINGKIYYYLTIYTPPSEI